MDYELMTIKFPYSFHTVKVVECERFMHEDFRDDYLDTQRQLPSDKDIDDSPEQRRMRFNTSKYFLPELVEHLSHLTKDVDYITGIRRGYLVPNSNAVHFYLAFRREEDAINFKLSFL